MTRAEARAEALLELLAMPDEPCLRRAHHLILSRDPKQPVDLIKRNLGMAYIEHRRQAHADISYVVSFARRERLKIVKRAWSK
jgi:hypothetical protein